MRGALAVLFAALICARRGASSTVLDMVAVILMAVGTMWLRKVTKGWDREDEPSSGSQTTSGGRVRAQNE